MSDLPTPTPTVTPETEEFWDATAEGSLLVRHCSECDTTHHYPRAQCPNCYSGDVEWVEASGAATIYSYTVTRGGTGGEYADATPYVVAYVELEEGPRIMTNIVDVDPDDVEVGQSVEVVFEDADGDAALPRFTPA